LSHIELFRGLRLTWCLKCEADNALQQARGEGGGLLVLVGIVVFSAVAKWE